MLKDSDPCLCLLLGDLIFNQGLSLFIRLHLPRGRGVRGSFGFPLHGGG